MTQRNRRHGLPIERLEPRRLMTFTPILAAGALTADQSQFGAANVDPNLVNPWGITVGPGGKPFTAQNLIGNGLELCVAEL